MMVSPRILLVFALAMAGAAEPWDPPEDPKNYNEPKVSFTASQTIGVAPIVVDFVDTSTGAIDTRMWDFDSDGIVDADAKEVSYTYEDPGTYSVTLTVKGPLGEFTTTTRAMITIAEPLRIRTIKLPAASALEAYKAHVHTEGGLQPLSFSAPGTEALGLRLDARSGAMTGVPTLAATGNHVLVVTVRDRLGQSAQQALELNVRPALIAEFNVSPKFGQLPLKVAFTDTSIGNIAVRRWDFDDDGIFDLVLAPDETHVEWIFRRAGHFDVRLEVENAEGKTASKLVEDCVRVYSPAPI